MTKSLLVFALPQESQDLFSGHNVLYTGVGKVNAAFALTRALLPTSAPLVVNLGTAGSQRHQPGTVISCTRFVQRDMDVTALGFAAYQTPFSEDPVEIVYGQALAGVPQGVCATGDSFDTSGKSQDFDAVDMEAYALAVVCKRMQVPFMCLKYISDGADGGADEDWGAALHRAAEALHKALKDGGVIV